MAKQRPRPRVADVRPCRKGGSVDGFEHVQEFLARFGYFTDSTYERGRLDQNSAKALAKYQERHGMAGTGDFDEETRGLMSESRCALPDMDLGVGFATTCAWANRASLTYAFDTGTGDVAGAAEFAAVRRAFHTWAGHIPLSFAEVTTAQNPDIRVGWRPASDPDYSMVGGTLAHADFPPGCSVVTVGLPKPVHFDDTEHTWSDGAASGAYDTQTVALHEIGHIMGLAHTSVSGAVMYPSVSSNFRRIVPAEDDVSGLQSLYHGLAGQTVTSWSGNRLDVFVRGTDRAMYHKWWNGSSWGPSVTGYEFMGGQLISAPHVVSWGPNRLDVFVRGTNNALYHKWWNGSSWGPSVTGWENLGGVISSAPHVVSWGPNRLDIFARGTNNALYHKWWNGSAWGPSLTGWENLGGVLSSGPNVVSWGPNRLDVFVKGTNNALYHKWWNGSSWGPSVLGYEFMGGYLTSAPTAVSWGANRLDVFVRGGNRALYHKWWNGSAWGPSVTGYEYMGGVLTSAPSVACWGSNRIDVFVRGTDNAMYHKWWNGSAWGPSVTAYEYMGGVLTSAPHVDSWGSNRLDVFVRGTTNALHHKWWNGSAWGPSVTGYEYMDGAITN